MQNKIDDAINLLDEVSEDYILVGLDKGGTPFLRCIGTRMGLAKCFAALFVKAPKIMLPMNEALIAVLLTAKEMEGESCSKNFRMVSEN